MPINILTNPTVRINNVTVTPKPNSVSITPGFGEKSVKGVSSGGGFSDIVISEDVETRVGCIKMSFYSTGENYELYRAWKSAPNTVGNIISVTEDDFHAVMISAVVVNMMEFNIGNEESFEVEFKGTAVQ